MDAELYQLGNKVLVGNCDNTQRDVSCRPLSVTFNFENPLSMYGWNQFGGDFEENVWIWNVLIELGLAPELGRTSWSSGGRNSNVSSDATTEKSADGTYITFTLQNLELSFDIFAKFDMNKLLGLHVDEICVSCIIASFDELLVSQLNISASYVEVLTNHPEYPEPLDLTDAFNGFNLECLYYDILILIYSLFLLLFISCVDHTLIIL